MTLLLSSSPRAILHVDGDCFFASCEVARRPELRGKPVVTGLERGIVSSLTYEAKARGIKRPMPLWQVRRICPEAVLLPSDYETYSLYSLRMFAVVRRFTPEVEEYGIDECFADLTGMRRTLRMSYAGMAARIKEELDRELGFTFSLGLAPSKVLAKVGSKWNKPSGLTVIPGRKIETYLSQLDIGKIWGIGPQTAAYLRKFGMVTALDFIQRDQEWVERHLAKPQREIWRELRGEAVLPLITESKSSYQSISKTKTFTPPSADADYILSQLSKNVENACIKLRRHKLTAAKFFFFLKTQDFRYQGLEVKLQHPSDSPVDIIRLIEHHFEAVFDGRKSFRASGIILTDLREGSCRQPDLFGEVAAAEKISRIFASADAIARRYGKHTLFLGSSFQAMDQPQHMNARQTKPERTRQLFPGETGRKRLGIPFLGEAD